MSSKKTKSTKESKVNKKSPRKKSVQHELVAPDCWINDLAEIDINDDSWKCSVTIVEEESTDSTVYMQHFNESTINGHRLSVKSISKLEIIRYVVKNIAENRPDKSPTPLSLLCSEIFKVVGPEFKQKIPTPLLASLIKYLILDYKDLNKTIREGMKKRKKELEEYQKSLWQSPVKTVSSKGTKSSKLENKSKNLEKVTKTKTSEKPFTKLRKRGEEWKDKTWIDDSPHDGPQLYIAISGFYDPNLPLELLHLNVPLHAIAKLSFWETSSATKSTVASNASELKNIFQTLQDFRHKSEPHLNSSIRKRLGNENDKAENSNSIISSFWKMIHKLKTELPTALMFKNVMFLVFTPDHFSFQYHIKLFQEEIYKQMSYFLYEVHEIATQYTQYQNEIKQTNVHATETLDLANMEIYQSLLDNVPHEVCNIPFLLDAVVIQVCGLENGTGKKEIILEESEKTNEQKSIPLASNYLTKLLKQLNFKYDLFSDQFSHTVFSEEKSKNNTDSCTIKNVLKHFDDTNIKTFHLQEDIAVFVRKRIAHILQVAWNDTLLDFFSVSHNNEHIVKLCSEIIRTAQESGENTLNYYIYILTVNSILNSLLIHDFAYSTLKMNSLKGSAHYDMENMCEDCILEVQNEIFSITSLFRNTSVSNLSNSNSKLSIYKLSDEIVESNLFYIEYMTTDVMLQWIQTAWYNFNKFETRYCPITNQVVIVLHNLLNSKVGVFEENWVGKLTTNVPIRDFVEYILEEEKDWLSQIHPKLTLESSKLEKAVTVFCQDKPLLDDLPFLFPEDQFISHRSLKYDKILKPQQKPGNQSKVQTTEKSKSLKTKTGLKQSDTSKKSKRNDKQKEKEISENKLVSEDSPKVEPLKKNYTFIGYDLGDPMRLQFRGLKKEKILDDCCRITLHTIEKLYGEKSQFLTVTMSGHSLYYMYKPYCESTLVNPFHLILSSGIVLYFGLSTKENIEIDTFDEIPETFKRTSTKQTSLKTNSSILGTEYITPQSIPMLGRNTEFVESNEFIPHERINSSCFPHTLKGVPYFEIPLTYDFKMSLPNGLHIELAKNSSLFYIRQTLLSKSILAKHVEKERLRCYTSIGCIIKFLSNDIVEILCPSGLLYSVFEIKEESFQSEKEEITEPTEGTITKSTLSDANASKNKVVLLKDKTEESSKSLKVKTVKKNGKKSTSSHNSTTTLINTENTKGQKTEANKNPTNIFDFKCTTSNGKRFTVQNNKVTKILKDLFVTHTTNVAENCINSERTDGLSTKHLAEGSLVVQFTDGSRITSTPVEAGEVFCEWSSEELNQWFANSTESKVETDFKTEKSLSKPSKSSYTENSLISREIEKTLASMEVFDKEDTIQHKVLPDEHKKELKMSVPEESSLKPDLEATIFQKSTRSLITSTNHEYTLKKPFPHEDGFVVYNVSYLMEHPNYSSVYYNANNCEVELKLPMNTNVTLKTDGCYEVYFDQASLTVDNDEIYFGKITESGDFERTAIINNSVSNNKSPIDVSNYFNRTNSLPVSVDEFCQTIGIKSLVREMVTKTEIKSGLLLYCVDSKINEIIVDYDFNIYELTATKDKYLTPEKSFTSMVVNENLSGFRLVSDEEVKSHLQITTEKHGLIQENDNAWKSLLTAIPVVKNESEKWMMNYQKNMSEKTNKLIKTSTYGRKESWIQPFVEKEEKCEDLVGYKAVIVRLFHRIPANQNILDKLKIAVENYNSKKSKNHHIRIFLDEVRVDYSLEELIRNPKLLCKVIKDENTKKNLEKDQFRRDMKDDFLRSLTNKAIIIARKKRKQNKEKELKSVLKRREIPPYHLSVFGYVHNILDEVFENVTSVCKRSSSTSTSSCEKVNFIIDELLSLVRKTKLESAVEEFDKDTGTNETDSIGIKSLVSTILKNVYTVAQDKKSQTHINAIMEKPLKLVTLDDIECISTMFGSGDCPILYDEEFILQDVLEARLQLSNYFENLRSMLEFYRGISTSTS